MQLQKKNPVVSVLICIKAEDYDESKQFIEKKLQSWMMEKNAAHCSDTEGFPPGTLLSYNITETEG